MPREFVLLAVCALIGFSACQFSNNPEYDAVTSIERAALPLVPLPSRVELQNTFIDISDGLYIVPALANTPLVARSLERFVKDMKSAGISTSNPQGLEVIISIDETSDASLSVQTDESYSLTISDKAVNVTASNYIGLNHALQTIGQLFFHAKNENQIQKMTIHDAPRFSWRGSMIDVSRHWIPIDLLKKHLDGMAIAKMNVLHLHLSDDQAFRMESKLFPRLHTHGSDGHYYTQKEMKSLVSYAKDRGIRIIPEFDVPGHTTSWLTAYPELAAKQQDYELQQGFGVFPNILNPVSDITFAFLNDLFSEMSGIFPDEYFHIGGDAILFDDWITNEEVTTFMSQNNLNDPRQVQAYFYLRVQQILQKLGKKMIGWDEVLRPELEKDGSIIQARHGHRTQLGTIKSGLHSVFSSGWNLEYNLPMATMYQIDPIPDISSNQLIPDSSQWEAWRLHLEINNLPTEGSLVLYGPPQNMTGVINLMDQSMILKSARKTSDLIVLDFTGGFGEASLSGEMKEQSFKGALKLAVSSINVSGEKIGGSDLPDGIAFPIYNPPSEITPSDKNRILGGEVCLWTEWADQYNLLSRLWPRSLAVAEKLWSPVQHTKNEYDFYLRSLKTGAYLIEQNIDYEEQLHHFATSVGTQYSTEGLLPFLQTLEIVKYFDRWSYNIDHTTSDSLNNVADIIAPESIVSYQFGQLVEELKREGVNPEIKNNIILQLENWIPVYRSIRPVFTDPKLKSLEVLALSLSDLSKIALHVMESGTLSAEESEYYERLKLNAQRKIDGVYLGPAPHLVTIIDRFRMEL